MCDHCSETFSLLQTYETRGRAESGRLLSKDEIMMVVNYFLAWPEKQCFCCFTKEQRNMERMNNVIQVILRSALQMIKYLPPLFARKHKQVFGHVREVSSCSTDKSTEKSEGDQGTSAASTSAGVSVESDTRESSEDTAMDTDNVELDEDCFTIDEKHRLLDFTQRVFMTNFPLYQIQKSIQPVSLETLFFNPGAIQRLTEEDLMPFETSTISCYCDMTKIEKMSMNYNKQDEPSAFFLRNICFLCDANMIQNVTECFASTDIHHLPVHMSHSLIQFIANVRYWLNPETIIQHIMPLRIPVIRYLCSLQQTDLRSFANRGLTDSILSAVKETPDRPAGRTFDGEGLALAYKFFNCESLSLRMAGIVQINNQIGLYNEAISCGEPDEGPRFGVKLADWLVEKELVVKIFGPNIHMEIVKNSQMILTFLAMEFRLSDRDLDSIWSSCQLKHCSKQVYDVLTAQLKNLDSKACKHVRDLISKLDPTEHNESTVVIASTLDKLKWHVSMTNHHHLHTAAIQQQLQPHVGPYTGLRSEPSTSKGMGKQLKRDHGLSTSGSEREEEETRMRTTRPNGSKKQRRRSLPSKCGDRNVEMETSGEEEVEDPCCRMHRALGAHAHHGADLHEDSLGSDSSLGAQSDLSEDSIQDERILEAAKIAEENTYRKHLHQHRHIHPNRAAMDSDECTDTSEDEEVEEEEEDEEEDDEEDEEEAAFGKEEHGEIRTKKESLAMLKREAGKAIGPKKVCKDHGRKKEDLSAEDEGSEPSKKLNESSEMETFEQEHTDVDLAYSDDEEVLKQAEMAQLKSFHRGSDSSDEDMEMHAMDHGHRSPPIHLGEHHHLKRHVDMDTDKIRGHQQVGPDDSNYPENIMSPESGGSASPNSQLSDKPSHVLVKGFSDDELERIHAQAQYTTPHVGPHLSIGNLYHHMPKSMMQHRGIVPRDRQAVVTNFTLDDVCKKGNTLIWDLVQDDVAAKLPEGLVVDAEKALHTLISFGVDRCIRAKFIEACVQNLADHKTIIISLRLLPKLFGSFHNYRGISEIHSITMWAEAELRLMHHFFEDLVHFTQTWNTNDSNALHSYKEEVQVRLSFLTMIYANANSPDTFRMNERQVDILWSCLVENPASADDCLQWFFNQAKSKEHHAMGLELFRHIFLEKMPSLNPEHMTMIGLNLFQHLSHLTRISTTPQKPLSEDQICGMDQLWEIILQATNQEVSMSATQYLNSYFLNYGGGQLEREEFFIKRCVEYLMTALSNFKQGPAMHLQRIHRGLILLKNHLELFSRRYAFHLRMMRLDGEGMTPHQAPSSGKCTIRLLLQPTGITEKTQIEMQMTDLVSELRAEVTRWWEILQKQQQQQRQQLSEMSAGHSGHSGLVSPILGAMLGDGPIRMIFLGQELTVDVDDKTLAEMQLKDNLLVFVSVGASRPPKKQDGTVPSSCLPAPDRSKMPLALLTQEPHFGNLFTLLEKLSHAGSEMENLDAQERARLQAEARRLSRVVWELLMMLPTSPSHLQGFTQQSGEPGSGDAGSKVDWDKLLPPDSPHRLYYSLQILEQLAYGKPPSKKTLMAAGAGDMLAFASEATSGSNQWKTRFMSKAGVAHLLNIVMSGTLQPHEGDSWSQWNQECLAYLLRIITQFSAEHQDKDAFFEDTDAQDSPRKKIRRLRDEKVVIPRLTQSTMDLLNVEELLKIVMKILYEAAYPADLNQLYMCSWGRAEVVSTALSLLVSVAYSSQEVHELQSATPDFTAWLKRLTLVAPEPYVRKEAAMGLYRLCLGHTADSDQGQTGRHYLVPILSTMLTFLSDAIQFKPERHNEIAGKEPFGPGCRDYFWLLGRLVEGYSKWQTAEQNPDIDLDGIASRCANLILTRPFYETRHGGEEDDGLCGMLGLLISIFKNNMPLKESPMGKALVKDLFSCCFALPSTSERHLPRCKSSLSRSTCYDLLIEICKGSSENYTILQQLLLAQHTKDSHLPYPFEYWPQDNGRSKAGFCGIQNLGATCYMAAALQFIFMIPEMREAILQAKLSECVRHHDILRELQKMFAFLQESERKAYNPRSFCKMYNMGNQPLNTGEQKDMQEFFTDLLTKMEEMTPTLKVKIKEMFRGVITNSVVSLDCPHVSRTFEEFSTIRCQVSDMKDLYASLDLVTVKDCLEGDNKYECGKCEGKVNVCAEKRACFRKLPEVLCINTMRYSFNFNTMMKEKLNSHFSFPRAIDMSPYMEHKLLGPDKMKDCDEPDAYGVRHPRDSEDDSFDYRLSGVTVHTGTADGGHYYTFIRGDLDKEDLGEPESWLLCNDAEVKPFDSSQIGVECFGGEMTSKTYDSVSDKFLDLSYEKTNSAYMLLYTRVRKNREHRKYSFELCPELAAHIWEDNMQYLKDRNIFEHSYFNFIWQVCGYLPNTMPRPLSDTTAIPNDVLLKATQLTASFVLETLIHSKEKPTMLQWIETLTKHFNKCHDACEWFLDHMATYDWWVSQIFIKCPTTMVRQLFHRLLFHVINELRPEHAKLYLETRPGEEISEIGNRSCVTRFVKKVLAILDTNVRQYSKHLSEYLHFLQDFAKMGDEECTFLLSINCISTLVTFYMGHKQDNPGLTAPQSSYVEILSEDEEEEEVLTMPDDSKPSPMEKMIGLIALLVEKSRGREKLLQLCPKDYNSIIGTGNKLFAFLLSQIREQIQLRQTCNIICSLTRWNDNLAVNIVNAIFGAIRKLGPENLKTGVVNPIFQHAQPFLKLLTFLVEVNNGAPIPGCPNFTQFILTKMWDLAKVAPVSVLEWLTTHVTRNKITHIWVLDQMDLWVEHYLIAHNNVRVRNAAVYLLISLVPCSQFRSSFRTTASRAGGVNKDLQMSSEALQVLHKVYKHLLGLLSSARMYVDPQVHGTMKLVCYFLVLQACVLSKREKLMFGDYFKDLWQLFQPKLLEPQIATHHNKQSLLNFWYLVCVDCPENVELITTNPHVCRNIAFNYILADHEDQDIMMFNRMMLPSYYGLLRLCCQHSRTFTRQLSLHQNIVWAFKNITPYPSQYTHAVEELYKIMRLMSARYADSTEDELQAVCTFRRSTILMYLRDLEARTHWQTLLSAFKILVETHEERIVVLFNNGLTCLSEAFMTLHVMYHEATACHVTNEIMDILTILSQCLRTVRECMEKKAQSTNDMKGIMANWKERGEVVKKLLTLLNSYTPSDIRTICFDVLKQMILILQPEMITLLVPYLTQWHTAFQDNNGRKFSPHKDSLVHSGPFFPRRGQKPMTNKSNIRPPRPQFQMMLHTGLLESMRGVDEVYDQQIYSFFIPYHQLLDTLQRLAINLNSFNQSLINLGAMVALEGVSICSPYFAKLWNEIYDSESADPDHSMVQMLCNSRYFIDYCDTVLMDERSSLNNFHIFKFFKYFFPKVYEQVLRDQATTFINNLVAATVSEKSALKSIYSEEDVNTVFKRIGGDVRAMNLLFSVLPNPQVNPMLVQTLHQILRFCQEYHEKRLKQERLETAAKASSDRVDVDDSEVRSDDEQVVTSHLPGGVEQNPPSGAQKMCVDDGDHVSSTTSDSKEGTKGKAEGGQGEEKEVLAAEERDCDGEAEVMCVDVTEASESIEVCTTPSTEDVVQDPDVSHSLKRPTTDDDSDAPACKRRYKPEEGVMPLSPKQPSQKGDSPEPKQVSSSSSSSSSSQEGKGSSSQQTENPERENASQRGKPAGRCSPQPGPSKQDSHPGDSSVGDGQPGPSWQHSERRSSRECEEGPHTASTSFKGVPSTSKSGVDPNPKNIVDKVRVDIEELLRVLDRAASSS